MVNDQNVIDTWNGAGQTSGKISTGKDGQLSLHLSFRLIYGKSFMRVYWEWEGHPREIIPESALWFDGEQESGIMDLFRTGLGIDTALLHFDVGSIIDIHTPEELEQKRNSVIEFLWGDEGFPFEKLPAAVTEGIEDADFESLENLRQIDKLTVSMEFGLNSYVYHFIPISSNCSAAIYHQGHGGKFTIGSRTIEALLKEGYDVYALSMPLLGMNNKPVVHTGRFGKLYISSHEYMAFLIPEKGNSVKYFMEPVAATVNYAVRSGCDRIIMAGLSGGGWTTTLYSAIDPRIDISFPVAGSLPVYLRSQDLLKSGTLGDFEQRVPGLYDRANYLELYIMGAYGKGRSHLQILNQFDACCFSGTGFRSYEPLLKQRLQELGEGKYGVFLDSTHRLHHISPRAVEVILEYLRNN